MRRAGSRPNTLHRSANSAACGAHYAVRGFNCAVGGSNCAVGGSNCAVGSAHSSVGSANTQVESANTRVESANTRVGSSNKRVGSSNKRVGSANKQVEDSNKRVESANKRVESANKRAEDSNTRVESASNDVSGLNNGVGHSNINVGTVCAAPEVPRTRCANDRRQSAKRGFVRAFLSGPVPEYHVLFSSRADNFPGDYTFPDPFSENVFLYDRETGITTLKSWDRSNPGTAANADSFNPAISGDGGLLAFTSNATNLVSPPIDPERHVWGRKHTQGAPAFVISRASGQQGATGNGPSDHPAVSHDGRFIAFQSLADNLTTEGGNSKWQIFLRDREENETTCISLNLSEEIGNEASRHPAIAHIQAENPNEDEIIVALESDADDFVAGDNNATTDVFVRLAHDDFTDVVTRAYGSTETANRPSFAPSISADGNRIAFHSDATNLLDPSQNITIHSGHSNVYVYDRTTEEMTLVSVCPSGDASGTQSSMLPSISPDGRFVAFLSYARNLLEDEDCEDISGSYRQVLVRDLEEQTTYLVSADDEGDPANASCHHVNISKHGRFISFSSLASNLTPEADGASHVFIRDRGMFPCGDLNGDGIVDNDDLAIMELHIGCECSVADLNGDGVVDQTDLDILDAAMQGPPSLCGAFEE